MKSRFILFLSLFIAVKAICAPAPGNGWTIKAVSEGITYYEFRATDAISGSPQQIFIIDWDTANPAYQLRFTWTEDSAVTSDVFRRENAVAALNAAYEPESTVVKVGGHYHSCMPKDTVMLTPVPNWKSEGAVCTDAGGRKISISFDGKCRSIAEQRAFYANSSWDNLFTSAPMLIDDYEPVGAFFVDSTLTAEQLKRYNYEDPIRHQGVRHPRTAVALTEDGHFLMVAVDGRRKGVSEGMSARELTRFLERWFHPRYALNMDGGGSTTLCVRGEGDPKTNVVNYPTGNKKYDHAGERRLFSHFCIVESPASLRAGVREEVRTSHSLASGLDRVYDFSPKAATPAPKGYEPVYVSHYGRHGSRYAYTAKAYTMPMELLRKASEDDNLTGRGTKLLEDLEHFWEQGQYRVGELTPLGWAQHERIAREMVQAYRPAFGKGSRVDACSSASTRAIVSMASFCASVAREAPQAGVYAHQGVPDIQATRPNMGKNPFRYTGPQIVFPFAESPREFLLRRMPGYGEVLSRLFREPSKAMKDADVFEFFFNYYMLIAGMASIPEEERIDTRGLLTDEEFAMLWEMDNYERFREYLPYKQPCASIVDDIIAKADARLGLDSPDSGSAASSGITRGADLRFGHDHVLMSLLMAMDIDGFAYIPPCPDDLVYSFQTFRSPMAANIQMVFYVPAKAAKKGVVAASDVLVKVLLNGEQARFGTLPSASGPYYRWSDLRNYLSRRVELFVNR